MSFILNPLNSVVPIGGVAKLTGNSGGAVGPDGSGNINIVGTGDVLVTDNPGTNTLTISVTGGIPETFDADSGSATSSGGIININGGAGIATSASGNTIVITATDAAIAYKNVATSPYTVLSTDYYLSVDCSGGAITLNFPNAATLSQTFVVKDRTGNANAHNITITTPGGTVDIDGATTFVMNTAYESVNIIGNATSYELY